MLSQIQSIKSRQEEFRAYGEENNIWNIGAEEALKIISTKLLDDNIHSLPSTSTDDSDLVEPTSLLTICSNSRIGNDIFSFSTLGAAKIYLHPLNIKMLLLEYKEYRLFPYLLNNRILEVEEILITDNHRKKYAFLRHLPLQTRVHFVELDLSVSSMSWMHFYIYICYSVSLLLGLLYLLCIILSYNML